MRKIMDAFGNLIDPFNLTPNDFNVEVVAQALSRICRFRGQTTEFYSVAQHCIAMSRIFDDLDLKKWGLAHEFFEGLTGMDIPSPIKHGEQFKEYRDAEERCLNQVADIFNLSKPLPEAIQVADKRMMVTEALRFMSSENYDWTQIAKPYHIGVICEPMSFKEAQKAFLDEWYKYF